MNFYNGNLLILIHHTKNLKMKFQHISLILITIFFIYSSKTTANEFLFNQLEEFVFKNKGIHKRTDKLFWKSIPISYLECQNCSKTQYSWADLGETNYLYKINPNGSCSS